MTAPPRGFARLTAHDPPGVPALEVDDEAEPSRVRNPLDALRLALVGTGMLVLLGWGLLAGRPTDVLSPTVPLTAAPGIARFVTVLVLLAGTVAPLAVVVSAVLGRRLRNLAEASATGLLTAGTVFSTDLLVTATADPGESAALRRLVVALDGAGFSPGGHLDPFLAGVLAFAVVARVSSRPWLRTWVLTALAVYGAGVMLTGQHSAYAFGVSAMLGGTVGLAVRLGTGQLNDLPHPTRVAEVLAEAGLPVTSLRRREYAGLARAYEARTPGGDALEVRVLDRPVVTTTVLIGLYRLLRVNSDLLVTPALSLESRAERHAVLAMAASQAGVRTPTLLACVPCDEDAAVLVYRHHDLVAADHHVSDLQLQAWHSQLMLLHGRRITHRGITPDGLRTDATGGVMLPTLTEGSLLASGQQLAVDRAQMLVSQAVLVGPRRAVAAACAVWSPEQVGETLPLLHPTLLSPPVRRAVRHAARSEEGTGTDNTDNTGETDEADEADLTGQAQDLLAGLREELGDHVGSGHTDSVKVERFRPRTVISIVLLLVAAYLVVGQLSEAGLSRLFTGLRWQWVLVALLGSALTYLGAALGLIGVVRERLGLRRTMLVQLATSFANLLTPQAIGGAAVNVRFLTRRGVPLADAGASVGTLQVLNAVWHVVGLLALLAATGTARQGEIALPSWTTAAVGIVLVVVLVLLAWQRTRVLLRDKVLRPFLGAVPRMLDVLTTPRRLAANLGGAVLLNGAYVLTLWASVHAFGGTATLLTAAIAYFAAVSIGALSPTPGGLGTIEVALVAALTTSGVAGGVAVSAVLLYRLTTLWLPVPLGWLAFHRLQRDDLL
ncbi:flippase-like domain-containing protein [Nocardioidaceae bacterium]|nr:flippase-like domain-containing protein [Nocardioidaceae bacterium]